MKRKRKKVRNMCNFIMLLVRLCGSDNDEDEDGGSGGLLCDLELISCKIFSTFDKLYLFIFSFEVRCTIERWIFIYLFVLKNKREMRRKRERERKKKYR